MYYGFYVTWVALGSFLFPNTPGLQWCSHVFLCEASVKIWTLKHLSCVSVSVSNIIHCRFHEVSRSFNMTFFTLRRRCPFLYPERVWTVFRVLRIFKDQMGGNHLDFFLYIYQLLFFMYDVKVCVYLNMLRIPEIPSKPKELYVSFSSTNSGTPQSIPLNNGRHLEGGGLTFSDFRSSHCPVLAKLDPTLTLLRFFCRMSNITRTEGSFWRKKKEKKKKKIPMVDFHVNVISKLCLWLSLFVFD